MTALAERVSRKIIKYPVQVGAPFYRDLMKVLNEISHSRVQAGGYPVRYQDAIEAMGYQHDSITGKIKNGIQVPANNRIEALAKFLGISPQTFNVYVQRFAESELEEGRLLPTYRHMMNLTKEQRKVLSEAIDKYVGEIISHMT